MERKMSISADLNQHSALSLAAYYLKQTWLTEAREGHDHTRMYQGQSLALPQSVTGFPHSHSRAAAKMKHCLSAEIYTGKTRS